jgi:hypothetical protein
MEIVDDDVLDLIAGDRFSLAIDGPLRHDDDVQPLTVFASAPRVEQNRFFYFIQR